MNMNTTKERNQVRIFRNGFVGLAKGRSKFIHMGYIFFFNNLKINVFKKREKKALILIQVCLFP